jgi:protein dithiol oxidoreductase (disulfide-forming)
MKALWRVLGLGLLAGLVGACGEQPQNTTPAPRMLETPATTGTQQAAQAGEPAAPLPKQESEVSDEETVDTAPRSAAPALRLASRSSSVAKTASQFVEGVHYARLLPTQPTLAAPEQVEVLEFFWYGCARCFALENVLDGWQNKPSYLTVRRVPVLLNDNALVQARLFYALESLGNASLHNTVFREIHLTGKPLNNLDEIGKLLADHGVTRQQLQTAMAPRSTDRRVQEARVAARRYRIGAVPTLVVNGKYTIAVGEEVADDTVLRLLEELAAREHASSQ